MARLKQHLRTPSNAREQCVQVPALNPQRHCVTFKLYLKSPSGVLCASTGHHWLCPQGANLNSGTPWRARPFKYAVRSDSMSQCWLLHAITKREVAKIA